MEAIQIYEFKSIVIAAIIEDTDRVCTFTKYYDYFRCHWQMFDQIFEKFRQFILSIWNYNVGNNMKTKS